MTNVVKAAISFTQFPAYITKLNIMIAFPIREFGVEKPIIGVALIRRGFDIADSVHRNVLSISRYYAPTCIIGKLMSYKL